MAANANWRGGVKIDRRQGYRYLKRPDDPRANKQGYVAEHRVVAEEKHGRALEPFEIVHHIDGDGGNNRPANLEIHSRAGHIRVHGLPGSNPCDADCKCGRHTRSGKGTWIP